MNDLYRFRIPILPAFLLRAFLYTLLYGLASAVCVSPLSSRQSGRTYTVRFIVTISYPANQRMVYLTGNTEQLGNWNPSSLPMTKITDSLWTSSYRMNAGEKIEFKLTAGSWWTQALDSTESIYDNIRLTVTGDTALRIPVYGWLNRMVNGQPLLDSARFRPARPALVLDDLWRYHPGDNPDWAGPGYDDAQWVVTNPYLNWQQSSGPRWDKIGWFRFRMYVDSSLYGKSVAFAVRQMGASEIYYNGKRIYSFGTIDTTEKSFVAFRSDVWHELRFDPAYAQLIAVRYQNLNDKAQISEGFNPGILVSMKDLNSAFPQSVRDVRSDTVQLTIFTLIPLILFFIHLFLYGFYQKQKQNLFYAICLLGFSGITFFNFQQSLTQDPGFALLCIRLTSLCASVAIFFGLLTIYAITAPRLPKRWWFFLALFLIVTVVVGFNILEGIRSALVYLYFGFTLVDGIVVSIRAKGPGRGTWLILVGYLILNAIIILQILIDYAILPRLFGVERIYVYGMLSLAVSMSIYLAYNFGWINRDLERQLRNVKDLSEKAVEQERIAAQREAERRIVAAENDRKNRELESARELQLSLLPRDVPRLDRLDIACFMKTATEVGGDYYDFFVTDNGRLTVALGDATGHGLKAGNMVIVTKGLLNILAGQEHLPGLFSAANRAIKNMNLRMLTMCLAVIRLQGTALSYCSAGMPPLIIYRAGTGRTEILTLKAMPLGAVADFTYHALSTTLLPGDVVLMISDGLTELFNGNADIYGTDNILQSLSAHATKPAAGIVQDLYADGLAWAGGAPLADDLTIVVIKSAR